MYVDSSYLHHYLEDFVMKTSFHYRLYSCLANGSAEEFQKGDHLYKAKAVKNALQIGKITRVVPKVPLHSLFCHIYSMWALTYNIYGHQTLYLRGLGAIFRTATCIC